MSLPVQFRLSSSVPLDERYYVQVYIDGLEGPRASDETFEITGLEPGDHAIAVSLMNRGGGPAGAMIRSR